MMMMLVTIMIMTIMMMIIVMILITTHNSKMHVGYFNGFLSLSECILADNRNGTHKASEGFVSAIPAVCLHRYIDYRSSWFSRKMSRD